MLLTQYLQRTGHGCHGQALTSLIIRVRPSHARFTADTAPPSLVLIPVHPLRTLPCVATTDLRPHAFLLRTPPLCQTSVFFFLNSTATSNISTLPIHDPLPI